MSTRNNLIKSILLMLQTVSQWDHIIFGDVIEYVWRHINSQLTSQELNDSETDGQLDSDEH